MQGEHLRAQKMENLDPKSQVLSKAKEVAQKLEAPGRGLVVDLKKAVFLEDQSQVTNLRNHSSCHHLHKMENNQSALKIKI